MSKVINDKLDSLSKSKFRSSFHLNKKMKEYVKEKGYDTLRSHAHDFINERLKVMKPNDGKQTPMRQVHPIFIAQHACACCCRGCIYKWHHIPKDKILSDKDISFLTELMIEWIKREMN
jgi:exodeoxyribonuclease V alpha subunit